MMLPGYEGKRYYVNALTGFSADTPRRPHTTYSVHDAHYSCRELARFPRHKNDSRPPASQRDRALRLANELNAEHDAWLAAA